MAGLTEEERIRFMGDTTGLAEEEKLNLETAARLWKGYELPGYVAGVPERSAYAEDAMCYSPFQKKWYKKPYSGAEAFEFWTYLLEREAARYKERKIELKYSAAQGNRAVQAFRVSVIYLNGQPHNYWTATYLTFNDKHQIIEDCRLEPDEISLLEAETDLTIDWRWDI